MLLPIVSGRCYTTEADVIAYCILYHFMADVVAIICGRCYYHFMSCSRMLYRADVIAQYVWQMLQPLRLMLLPAIFVFIGWCYCQCSGRCYDHLI